MLPLNLSSWLAAFSIFGLASSRPQFHDGYPRVIDIDVTRYRFSIVLSDQADSIAVEATVDFRFLGAGRTSLPLDLIERNPAGKGMTVESVSDSVGRLEFVHREGKLIIALRGPGVAGAVGRVRIGYRGTPAAGLKIAPNRSGDRTFSSDNWPDLARHWLATIDHPSDKAAVEFVVTAPAHYQVVANGLLVEETDVAPGIRRTTWRQSVPIAPWLFTVGVARYAVEHSGTVNGIPVQAWVYPQDRDQGFADFGGPTQRALRFYGSWVGPYAYEKLANIESVAAGGGMEAASAIGYTERLIGAPRANEVIVHEIAHQWFGNAVTERDWNDVWLSEGFATYFTLLFTEYDAGRDAFVAGLKKSKATVLDYDAKHPGYRVVHANLTDMTQVTSSQTYQKGSWTLHMLRGIVGTDTFWRGIREYYRRFFNGNASTDDFRQVMEEVSGQELAWFFNQWLTRSGSPVVAGAWQYDRAKKQVELTLTQSQPGDPFRVPLEIGIGLPGVPDLRIERVNLTGQHATFRFDADQEPTEIVLDPNLWVLLVTKLVKR